MKSLKLLTVRDHSWPMFPSLTAQMIALDVVTSLPDDIFVNVDRAAMAASLETRGPLCDWAETLIDATRLRQEMFFNPAPIRQKWAKHLAGKRNWAYHL